MPKNEEDYGLVVGVDHYPEYRSLRGACADAKIFYTWLSDNDEGGGVPEDNRRLLLSTRLPPVYARKLRRQIIMKIQVGLAVAWPLVMADCWEPDRSDKLFGNGRASFLQRFRAF